MSSSKWRLLALLISALVLAALSGFLGYQLAGLSAVNPGRRVLYWYDPMQPNQHFDKAGKSPFMDMPLMPRYADETDAGTTGIRIDPGMTQNLGLRLTKVQKGPLARQIDALGSLGLNERNVAVIQARSDGFVTQSYHRAPGDVIERGSPIVDLLMPEWTGAQREFIALLSSAEPALIAAARQRLLLLGMSAELIGAVQHSREPRLSVTVRSPLAGALVSLDARPGMSISRGSTIATVNGLATVWLEAALPEARALDIAVGGEVHARVTAFPAETFSGRVIAILPLANKETRTLRVRIELANPGGRLRPGMFATVRLQGRDSAPVLHVASEALIRTGARTLAIVASEGSRFIPTEVSIGADINGQTVVLEGLTEGQRVVSSAQFLIDSEASLKAVLARLKAPASPP